MSDVRQSEAALAAPHVEGLSRHVLRIQQCRECGQVQTLARYACAACGHRELVWRDVSTFGCVIAATVVTRAPSDVFASLAPYCLVIVKLDEGARVMGHGEAGVAIGDRVSGTFFEHRGSTLLRFVRA